MRQITVTLPDNTFLRLNEIIKSMRLAAYKPEHWVRELVVSEVAVRSRNEQRPDEPRLSAAARLVFAELQSISNSAPRERLARLEAIAGELRRIAELSA